MAVFQVPDLQEKLRKAEALARDRSTTPGERAAAKHLAGKLRAKLKALDGLDPTGPSAFTEDGSAPRNPPPKRGMGDRMPFSPPPRPASPSFDYSMFAEFFDGRIENPKAKKAPSNRAYPSAYGRNS